MDTLTKDFFQAVAIKANKNDHVKKMLKEWIGHHDGKLIQFQTNTENFYIVVTGEIVRVCDGEYPSPDVVFKGPAKLILDVFTLKKSMEDVMKHWELVVMGAGHDGFALRQLVTAIMGEV